MSHSRFLVMVADSNLMFQIYIIIVSTFVDI